MSIEQTFKGSCDFGERVKVTVPRRGDLIIYYVYDNYELPKINESKPKPTTLFQICSLVITKDELELLPKCIKEDCEENRKKLSLKSQDPLQWTVI